MIEVETPVMSLAGHTDPNIASFSLEFSGRTDGAPRERWLRTSPEYPLKRLLGALASGFPDCAGVALGVDRLLMAMLGTNRIADVLAFDFARA